MNEPDWKGPLGEAFEEALAYLQGVPARPITCHTSLPVLRAALGGPLPETSNDSWSAGPPRRRWLRTGWPLPGTRMLAFTSSAPQPALSKRSLVSGWPNCLACVLECRWVS